MYVCMYVCINKLFGITKQFVIKDVELLYLTHINTLFYTAKIRQIIHTTKFPHLKKHKIMGYSFTSVNGW